jgi:gamma-glutamylcyclotransferase (GGCT)/AIG2-like uncharacterized protein YtfP
MLPPSPRHVFVYGTLLPGLAPPVIADVVSRLRVVGPGSVPGRLYHFGAYPGCVLAGGEDCDTVIHGTLLELPMDDPAVLARLDWYEGYAAHDDAGSLFLRLACAVDTPAGGQVRAWVYVYNRDASRARPIAGGRYHPPENP